MCLAVVLEISVEAFELTRYLCVSLTPGAPRQDAFSYCVGLCTAAEAIHLLERSRG